MISGSLKSTGVISGTITGVKTISGGITIPDEITTEPFIGEYEYTPTDETQVVNIAGLRAVNNIVINPIPNNYGRVTWDGSILTIS